MKGGMTIVFMTIVRINQLAFRKYAFFNLKGRKASWSKIRGPNSIKKTKMDKIVR
jgi:hypothetical protein